MISGENIIYFGPEKWEGMWRNRHHLMSRFSSRNQVMYVEPVGYLNQVRARLKHDPVKWLEFLRAAGSVKTFQLRKGLNIYQSDKNTPITRRYPFEELAWLLWRIDFKRTLSKLDIKRPILWLSKPSMHHLIGKFGEKLVIYHVVDEYLAYSDVTPETKKIGLAAEKRMMQKADMVIVVSKSLYESKSPYNENTYLVPNAVDYGAYASVAGNGRSKPVDMADVSRPVIGYSGLISNRLDIELMTRVARGEKTWSLVLIGKIDNIGCENALSGLLQLPNVHYLGLKKIDDVPGYIHAFDVCILPYRENDETRNLSALKMYDYMATGHPIVATRFPDAIKFKDVVHIGGTPEEFVDLIKNALQEDNAELTSERKRIASRNTWDARVDQVSDLIDKVNIHGKNTTGDPR